MLQDPALLLVSSIIGLALAAIATLLRDRVPRWSGLAMVTVFAIVPLVLAERTVLERSVPRSLWGWTAVGGAPVQAAYHIDPLALIAACVVALASGVTLHGVTGRARPSPLLPALVATQGILLVVLVAVTDLVAATLVAGGAGALAVVVGLFVAAPSAAARLAALIALGLESFIAAALLLARLGVASFDLASLPASAAAPEVLAATTLGAVLFCGLYPFVPWRYEPGAVATPFGALRGIALFGTGVAGSVLAIRVVAASDLPTTELRLPSVPLYALTLALLIVLGLTALAVRAAPPGARVRRAATGGVFLVAVAAIPELRFGHIIIALAFLTVGYASLASAALVDEWRVARFDVRLAVLWAAIASGSPLALAGALIGLVASSLALLLELVPWHIAAGLAARNSARLLVVLGPLFALVGVAFADDPVIGVLAAIVLGWAALLELGHAVREEPATTARLRERWFAALAALATAIVVSDLAFPVAVRAGAVLPRGTLPADVDQVLGAMIAIAIALAAIMAALPQLVARIRLGRRVVAALRRVLAATDPAPALALAYHGLEAWSGRIGAGFASVEDRAGIWFAALLLALTVLWAATS